MGQQIPAQYTFVRTASAPCPAASDRSPEAQQGRVHPAPMHKAGTLLGEEAALPVVVFRLHRVKEMVQKMRD